MSKQRTKPPEWLADDVRSVPEFAPSGLKELMTHSEGPCVSIYVGRGDGPPDPPKDRLRFRAQFDRARDLIEGEIGSRECRELLGPLAHVAQSDEWWQTDTASVGAFVSPTLSRLYRLRWRPPDLVVVGPNFHTRPLTRYLQTPDRFWVLELGQGSIGLWSGDATEIHRIEPSPLPADIGDVLGYEYAHDSEIVHRAARPAGRSSSRRAQGGGSVGAFPGHGVGQNDREPELKKLFTTVDEALTSYLGDNPGPVVLAAVKSHHAPYRAITRLRTLAPSGIEASIHGWSTERIRQEAWVHAAAALDEALASTLSTWEQAYGAGKAETDPAILGRLAVAGRIRTLMIEQGRRLWGRFDRQVGTLEVHATDGEDPDVDSLELLDELAESVLLHGGMTLTVQPERMPGTTGVAGIVR